MNDGDCYFIMIKNDLTKQNFYIVRNLSEEGQRDYQTNEAEIAKVLTKESNNKRIAEKMICHFAIVRNNEKK